MLDKEKLEKAYTTLTTQTHGLPTTLDDLIQILTYTEGEQEKEEKLAGLRALSQQICAHNTLTTGAIFSYIERLEEQRWVTAQHLAKLFQVSEQRWLAKKYLEKIRKAPSSTPFLHGWASYQLWRILQYENDPNNAYSTFEALQKTCLEQGDILNQAHAERRMIQILLTNWFTGATDQNHLTTWDNKSVAQWVEDLNAIFKTYEQWWAEAHTRLLRAQYLFLIEAYEQMKQHQNAACSYYSALGGSTPEQQRLLIESIVMGVLYHVSKKDYAAAARYIIACEAIPETVSSLTKNLLDLIAYADEDTDSNVMTMIGLDSNTHAALTQEVTRLIHTLASYTRNYGLIFYCAQQMISISARGNTY